MGQLRLPQLPDWPPAVARVLAGVRLREHVVAALAALAVLAVLVDAVRVWPRLPNEVPIGWQRLGSLLPFVWRRDVDLRVPKSLLSAFGPLAASLLLLAVNWALIVTGLLSRMLASLRSQAVQSEGDLLAALEVCFYDGLFTWLVSARVVAVALDSWRLWSLCLGQEAVLAVVLLKLIGPAAALGLVVSLTLAYRRLRRVARG
jgi:hypothetical protein